MKKILLFLLVIPVLAGAQDSLNMTALSQWDNDNLPVRFGAAYNDCWGFRHANGTEIAILGGIEDIFFFNVTNPANPVLIYTHHVLNANGSTNQSLWRDFKSYQNYVYASADEGSSGLLVFNMSQVPATVTLAAQLNSTSFWHRAHNIYIDEVNGRLYAAGTNSENAGLKIVNLASSPTNPPIPDSINLTSFGGGYVHDVHVRNNIAYCSHIYMAKLNIYNMNNLSNVTLIASLDNYPEEGLNHSSWVNPETNMLVMADETQGSDLKLVNITNPGDISIDDYYTFYSELEGPAAPGSSIPHNPFIEGNLVYIAYYHDGVQVFDISNPQNITRLAFFDTYPQNADYSVNYQGCWGVYPYLPSGIVLASDQTNGLFVLNIMEGILDIDFLSFDAERESHNINLQWSVADASFGNNFEVMRSSDDGITFETIGTVKLVEQQSGYSFLDQHVQPQQKYIYRIDFVELDGKRIQSPTRVITSGNPETILKIVSPFSSRLMVNILKPIEQLELEMYDMEGRLVWTYREENPRARLEMNVAELIPGQYLLSAFWPGGNENVLVQVVK